MVLCFLERSSELSTYPYERPSQVQMYRDKPEMTIKSTQGVGDDNLRASPLRWPPVTETLDLDDLTKKKKHWTLNSNDNTLQAKHPRTLATRSFLCWQLKSPLYPIQLYLPKSCFHYCELKLPDKSKVLFKIEKDVSFFLKESTLLNIRRQQYENLPKVL